MLIADPEERITASEILTHEYFDQVSKLPKMYAEKNKEGNSKKKSTTYDWEMLRSKVNEKRRLKNK